jgi:hypothetical protein
VPPLWGLIFFFHATQALRPGLNNAAPGALGLKSVFTTGVRKRTAPLDWLVKLYYFLPRWRLIFIDPKGSFAYSSYGFRRERRRLERVCQHEIGRSAEARHGRPEKASTLLQVDARSVCGEGST